MTYTDPHLNSGAGLTASREFKFGPTYVVEPKGKHQATIVWLHGLGDDGLSWSELLKTVPLPNIKWICPTSPARSFTLFGGLPTTALLFMEGDILTALESKIVCNCKGFDVIDLSEDASQDVEGMDASAGHVLSLLSAESPNIKVGVGGFSMGAATAIYSACCFASGKFGNGTVYPAHLDVVVGLSGWIPCARRARGLNNEFEGYEVGSRAASLPILLCHGRGDDVIRFRYGEMSAEKLTSIGFEDLTFKSFPLLGHYTIPEEMDEVVSWLTSKLGLEGEP